MQPCRPLPTSRLIRLPSSKRAGHTLNGLSVARIEVLLFPVASVMRPLDPTPAPAPLRAFLALTSRSAPVLRIGTLASRFWPLGLSPFASERLVPAVPRDSLHPFHTLSTPVAVRSVVRHPTDLSQVNHTLLVLTTLRFLTTRLRRVHFRSSLECSPARVCSRAFPPTLTTMALYHSSLEAA